MAMTKNEGFTVKLHKSILAGIAIALLTATTALATSFNDLKQEAERARREYDLERAESTLVKLQAYALEQPNDKT